MKHTFLQGANFEDFLCNVNTGNMPVLKSTELNHFVSILPSDEEIQKFRDRLELFGLESFHELGQST